MNLLERYKTGIFQILSKINLIFRDSLVSRSGNVVVCAPKQKPCVPIELKRNKIEVPGVRKQYACLKNCHNIAKATLKLYLWQVDQRLSHILRNRPFSYSHNECRSNDISLQFVEFSNVHNCDRKSHATLSNLAYKIV